MLLPNGRETSPPNAWAAVAARSCLFRHFHRYLIATDNEGRRAKTEGGQDIKGPDQRRPSLKNN